MKSNKLIVFASIFFGLSFLIIYLNSPVFSTLREMITNSDYLFPFSIFQGLLNGIGMDGWTFTGHIPLFPDLFFGFIFWILLKNVNLVLIVYAIFQSILILACFIYLSKQIFGKNYLIISLITLSSTIPILLLATGQYMQLHYLLPIYQHFGLISMEIFALGLLIKLLINHHQGLKASTKIYVLLGIVVVLSTTGDPLFFIQFSIPAIIVIFLLAFISACNKKNAITASIVIIIASAVGFFAYDFPSLLGSRRFPLFGSYAKLNFAGIPDNLAVVLSQLSSFWSGHPWMVVIWGLFYLVCIFLTIKLASICLKQKIGYTRRRILTLALFLTLQLLVLIGATTITGSNTRWYYLPLVFIPLFWGWPFFIPLINKWKAVVRNKHFVTFSQGAIVLVSLGLIISVASRNNPLIDISEYYPSWVACIDNNAQKYQLHHGIADYWQARTLTLESKAGLSVAQVSPDLMPFRWENNSKEYEGNDFDFIILGGNKAGNYEIKLATVVDRFGEPNASFSCEGNIVLVYNEPKDKKFREQFTSTNSSLDLEKIGNKMFYYGSQLPSQVGTISGDSRIANETTSPVGFLTFGPYAIIPAGDYQFTIEYNGQSIDNSNIGAWDVSLKVIAQTSELLRGDILSGGNSIVGSFRAPVRGNIEIRVYYNGIGTLEVNSLQIERID